MTVCLPPEGQCLWDGSHVLNSDLPTGSLSSSSSVSTVHRAVVSLLDITNSPSGFSAQRSAWFMSSCYSPRQRLLKGLTWWIKRLICSLEKCTCDHNNNVYSFIALCLSFISSSFFFSFFAAFVPSTLRPPLLSFSFPLPISILSRSLSPSLSLCGFPLPLNLVLVSPARPLTSSLWDCLWALRGGGWLHYQAGLSGLSSNLWWHLSDWDVAAEQGLYNLPCCGLEGPTELEMLKLHLGPQSASRSVRDCLSCKTFVSSSLTVQSSHEVGFLLFINLFFYIIQSDLGIRRRNNKTIHVFFYPRGKKHVT